jgi:hypothetical protein
VGESTFEQQLVATTADPDIQKELQRIDEEFVPVAAGGLETL